MGDDRNGPGANQSPNHYVFSDGDWVVIRAAIQLLEKIAAAPFTSPEQSIYVTKLLHMMRRLPDVTHDLCPKETTYPTINLSLGGPTRKFGDQKIFHFWQVNVEEEIIEVQTGGDFHRASTGSDTFISFDWAARPGSATKSHDNLPSLWMVSDARPFQEEVESLQLDEPGFSLEVHDCDGSLVGD